MSNRVAILFRGLPSLPIEEMQSRFAKYYPEHKIKDVFHNSPSFIGKLDSGSISFTDRAGSYDGGTGLNQQVMADLRKMKADAETYVNANPNVYTNQPTSPSRAKLYKRIGFQDAYPPKASEWVEGYEPGYQAMDTRRIATEDLPYVKALDAILQNPFANKALGNQSLAPFIKSGDKVVSMSRMPDFPLLAKGIAEYAPDAVEEALKNKREMRNFFSENGSLDSLLNF